MSWSHVTMTANPARSAAASSAPFSNVDQFISYAVEMS